MSVSASTTGTLPPRTLPYIGDSDDDVLRFIMQLAQQLQENPGGPEAFGLTVADLADIVAARDRYSITLATAISPATNSRAAVVAKNSARDEADRIGRMYAQLIKNQPPTSVSRDMKVIAGVPVPKDGRTRTRPPGSFPYLYVNYDGAPFLGSNLKLSFRDSALNAYRMPREAGVTHLIVHAQITAPFVSPRQIVAFATRMPFRVPFDSKFIARFNLRPTRNGDPAADVRAVELTFRGQWLNSKGETGPIGHGASIVMPVTAVRTGAVVRSDAAGDIEPAVLPRLRKAA